MFVAGVTLEEVGDEFTAAVAHAATIDADETLDGQVRDALANTFERACDAALNQEASLGQIESEHPARFASPVLQRVTGEQLTRFVADPIVVHPEVCGMWMRDIDGDQRNVCGCDLVRDNGRDFLLDLELDHEIDAILHELFGVAQGGGSVVAVVENQQIDSDG